MVHQTVPEHTKPHIVPKKAARQLTPNVVVYHIREC